MVDVSLSFQGFTATSSMRRESQCMLGLTLQCSSTTNQCLLGFGEDIINHNHTLAKVL